MQLTERHLEALESLWHKTFGLNIGTGFLKGRCGDQYLGFIPAIVARVSDFADYDEFNNADDIIIEYKGTRYGIGKTALRMGITAQPDRSGDRLLSPDYLLLFLASLTQLSPEDKRKGGVFKPERISLIVPLNSYNQDRETIKKYLSGQHEVGVIKRGKLTKTICFDIQEENISVLPEGRGTLSRLTITEDGLPHDPDGYMFQSMGVVNIGSGTTELLFFDKMKPIAGKTHGHGKLGLGNVWKALRNLAQSKFNFEMDDYSADEALRNGFFLVGDHAVYISPEPKHIFPKTKPADSPYVNLAETLITEEAKQIANFISTSWQGGKDVYRIPLAGGGGKWFNAYLEKRFSNLGLVDDPIYSEASGAFLYAIMKELEKMGILKDYMK